MNAIVHINNMVLIPASREDPAYRFLFTSSQKSEPNEKTVKIKVFDYSEKRYTFAPLTEDR
jgi:hypothetical protein